MPEFNPPPNRLRVLRVERGLKQADLAELAGCNPASISRWEVGTRRIALSSALHLARALGVDVGALGVEFTAQERELLNMQTAAIA